jgi:hypothetical protein
MNSSLVRLFKPHYWLVLLVIICITFFGCLPPRPSSECNDFYNLTPQQRKDKVRASPVEKQLNLYWCGMYQEPPTDFAEVIATGGIEIIPFLLGTLKEEKSETRQDLIIHIFEVMAIKGYLRGRPEVITQLNQIVSAMKISDIKKTSQQRLKAIESTL